MELIYRNADAFSPSRGEAPRVGVESVPCRVPSRDLVVELGVRVTLSAADAGAVELARIADDFCCG